MRVLMAAFIVLLTLSFAATAGGDTGAPTALPAELADLWEGGDRCGDPTVEQWVLTFEMGYPLAAELASQAKVIPYRFVLEDLIAAVRTGALSMPLK